MSEANRRFLLRIAPGGSGVSATLAAFLLIASKKIMQRARRWASESLRVKTAARSTPCAALTPSRSSMAPWRLKIRALWPCEHEHFLRHLLRLDGVTRNERFGRGVSDDWIARYAAETDWLRGVVLGCWIDGTLRGAAELRRDASRSLRSGETALSIEPAFQNQGLGTFLARGITDIARRRGIATLHMVGGAGNERVRRIVQKLGARMTLARGTQFEAELTLSPHTMARSPRNGSKRAP
jgi:GNAT superfamily N-acetyltransferase